MDKLQEKQLSKVDTAAAADVRTPVPVHLQGQQPSTADFAAAADKRASAPAQPQNQKIGLDGRATRLLPEGMTSDFRRQWDQVQTGFVDEPRHAVEQADSLVAQVMQNLAKTFADERGKLEAQWSTGDNVSTEDLRLALQRYRLFFSRLLSI